MLHDKERFLVLPYSCTSPKYSDASILTRKHENNFLNQNNKIIFLCAKISFTMFFILLVI